MGAEGNLIAGLKKEFEKRPVVSNVIFGFIMTGVEKMLEVEFACPCNPTWNGAFVAPFFLIPACTASSLMLLIHGCSGYESVLCSFLPPIVWLALMFLDGQYLVCAMTGWPGTFVTAKDTYLKWCKPINATNHATMLNQSHRFYILSQGFGNCIVAFLLVVLIAYMVCTRGKREKDEKNPETMSLK